MTDACRWISASPTPGPQVHQRQRAHQHEGRQGQQVNQRHRSTLSDLLAGAGHGAKVFTPAASGFGSSTAGGADRALSSRTMGRRAAYSATLFAASSVEREIMEDLLWWFCGASPESRRQAMVVAG
jgi:hypothetical protein